MNRGAWYAVGAYLAWGLFPIYWKVLHQVPAFEMICHRILWSSLTLYGLIALRGKWRRFIGAFKKPRIIGIYLAASLLIGLNWFVFIWEVNAGYVIEVSLGYFINPLISVLFGAIIFRERLRMWQWVSIGLAAAAVLYLTMVYGSVPRVALTLAITFGLYGMVKKMAPLDPVNGLAIETSLLVLPAGAYLAWLGHTGQASYLHMGIPTLVLLMASGLVTTLPLVLFAAAAQRIPLAQIGVLQYIAPSMQFLLGALVYHERFTVVQFGGFVLVWISLALFAAEGAVHVRSVRSPS